MKNRSLEKTQQDFAAELLAAAAPAGRIGIYHHNRRANFHKALALSYPVIERMVGEDFFVRLALEFMTSHPSRSGDLHHAGRDFPAFLAAGIAAPGAGYEYLADVARLEWAWQSALLAADAPVLDSTALADFPQASWPQLRFTLQPAVQLLASPWPIHTLFREHRREQPDIVYRDAGGECVGVLRRDRQVEAHRLTRTEFRLWQALAAGATLAEAVTAVGEDFDLGQVLGRLFALGAVAGLTAAGA